jgi:L-threonylcarbamoyladenylate synthase
VSPVVRLPLRDWSPDDLADAVAWLRRGGVVAYPTDTLYGLAVDPTSAEAVGGLFETKGRSPEAPIPLIAGSQADVERWFGPLAGLTARLAKTFWPGPLSLLLDAPVAFDPAIAAGTKAIAVRVPDHVVARAFAEACGHPITATSANRSGEPPATRVLELGSVADDPRVLVIDAGDAPGGAPSTIADARGTAPRILREGAISRERVLRSLED